MQVKDILASVYVLLDNATEQELDLSVALELFGSTLSMMNYEQIFGNLDDIVRKSQVSFTDGTGIVSNTLTDFGDAVFLKFNNEYIDEAPVSQLELYRNSQMQRVAFWTDASNSQKFIQLATPTRGTLEVWYEPYTVVGQTLDSDIALHESLKWCLATRLALDCLPYVKFKSPMKLANKPSLALMLNQRAEDWKKVYLEKVNRIGTNKPFTRIPFMARH